MSLPDPDTLAALERRVNVLGGKQSHLEDRVRILEQRVDGPLGHLKTVDPRVLFFGLLILLTAIPRKSKCVHGD